MIWLLAGASAIALSDLPEHSCDQPEAGVLAPVELELAESFPPDEQLATSRDTATTLMVVGNAFFLRLDMKSPFCD
jgi:hypothetical protein